MRKLRQVREVVNFNIFSFFPGRMRLKQTIKRRVFGQETCKIWKQERRLNICLAWWKTFYFEELKKDHGTKRERHFTIEEAWLLMFCRSPFT